MSGKDKKATPGNLSFSFETWRMITLELMQGDLEEMMRRSGLAVPDGSYSFDMEVVTGDRGDRVLTLIWKTHEQGGGQL